MAESKTVPEPEAESRPAGNPYIAALTAWILPGAGHFYCRRPLRGAAFLLIVLVTFIVGWQLDGRLYQLEPGHPLTMLGALGEMGMGAGYIFLRLVLGYEGTITAPGHEYGTAFLLTAGLMNILLVLDAWDISRGRKA